jgi:hypothetical protein
MHTQTNTTHSLLPPHKTPSKTVELAQSARRLYGELLPAFEALFSRRKNARFLEVISFFVSFHLVGSIQRFCFILFYLNFIPFDPSLFFLKTSKKT